MSKEVFRQVTNSEIPKVLEALKKGWPKHFLLHQLLRVFELYKSKGSKFVHELYLCGDYENGVYFSKIALTVSQIGSLFYYVDSTNPHSEVMYNALRQTQLISWKGKNFCFSHIYGEYSPVIQRVLSDHEVEHDVTPNILLWLPPHKEVKIKPLPTDLTIEPLDESFAQQMNNGSHRSPVSDVCHQEHLKNNFGLGLFRKSDRKLIASALSNYTGGIFTLFCEPEFRGNGFATMLVGRMAQEIKQRDWIPFCTVILGNKRSEAVFLKVGFEVFCFADYLLPRF